MRTKEKVYKKDQEKIVDEILNILSLNENKTITLYELDNDYKKQEEIMKLIPKIRKYYSFNNWKAVGEPSRIKRPWLSIIKQLTKSRYKIIYKDYRIRTDQEIIRTTIYHFIDI